MTHALLAALRARTYAEQVLEPAAFPVDQRLRAEVLRPGRALTAREAAQSEGWQPVEPGWRWGPVWSTAWFRLRGEVREGLDPGQTWLRFCSGTEALLWRDGAPTHGLDENRRRIPIDPVGAPGDAVELLIEADCNRPLGATTFFFDEAEVRRRWAEPNPGRFEGAGLCRRDPVAWRLLHAFLFVADLVEDLGDGTARGDALQAALEHVRTLVDPREPGVGAAAALDHLTGVLANGATDDAGRCFAVGHAHLDTAWLWTTAQTRRKALRTFSTALRTIEDSGSFHFLCSQPQQYAWLEEDSPQLFERVRAAVDAGRWEPLGAMWIEPDANMPSGESLCRQLEQGTRYMESRFGVSGRQRLLYLPDTFGFCASLPQLARLAGLDTFITNKLWWSETTTFPHTTFTWRGLDGSEILAHLTPGQDYNATVHPVELRRGERITAERETAGVDDWLLPYGFGDGGGGPTPEQAWRAELAADAEGLPRVDTRGTAAFCEHLHAEVAAARDAGRELPVHEGELYLELHRGTWTSQASLKQLNAFLEARLRGSEVIAALTGDEDRAATCERVQRTLLLNQFHDILPGSGTREVVEEAVDAYIEALIELDRGWKKDATRPTEVVFNPSTRAQVLCFGEEPLAGLGLTLRTGGSRAVAAGELDDLTLVTDHFRATFDEAGRVRSLVTAAGRELAIDGRPIAALRLHDDRPRRWEAWDIDPEDHARFAELDGPCTKIEPLTGGPGLVFERRLATGTVIKITWRASADGRGLGASIHCTPWKEERKLLRMAFPVAVRADHWKASIPFGFLERPLTLDTPSERARFEVPIQRWMDLSGDDAGLAVLNDSKYGASGAGDTLGLSLLRATRFPDPAADSSLPLSFRIELVPHDGPAPLAEITARAEALPWSGDPARIDVDSARRAGPFELVQVAGGGAAFVSSLRLIDGGLRLRIWEGVGAPVDVSASFPAPVRAARAVDLRGAADPRLAVELKDGRPHLRLAPFQVATLDVELDR
ncbi:alpha-mannosidase [Engelhardtia mirabilis]|uniref:alpha-mannosidase n=1 Tax=Engelhardtia mirabilis TaxID=2528011 RepID=UPI003AF37FFB